MRLPFLLLAMLTCVTGCDSSDSAAPAGGLTAGEIEQLENAANRLDNRAASPAADDAAALESDIRAKLDAERQARDRR